MSPKFRSLIDQILPLHERLLNSKPVHIKDFLVEPNKSGVYLFTDPDSGNHLYVGRSNRIRKRWGEHCNSSSKHNEAPFAFKLAREETGKTKASYQSGSNSRNGLLEDVEFNYEFEAAKKRIREMEFRYVEVGNPNEQCLLEFYAAVTLGARYNDFDNH